MGNYLDIDTFLSFKTIRHITNHVKTTVENLNKYELPPLLLVAQENGSLDALDMDRDCISGEKSMEISPLFNKVSQLVKESQSPVFALMFVLPSESYNKPPQKNQKNEIIASENRPTEYSDQIASTLFAMYYLDEFNRKFIIQDFVFTKEDGFQWELPHITNLSDKEELSPSKWWNWNEIQALNLLALNQDLDT